MTDERLAEIEARWSRSFMADIDGENPVRTQAREDTSWLLEREKKLREALEGADARFEEILYAKGSLAEKVERMAQEAYFGQKEVVKALADSGETR